MLNQLPNIMIAGVDEAGRGPVFGPIVIALVGVQNKDSFASINLKDSKKCSRKQRERFAAIIKKKASNIKVLSIPAKDIDVMRQSMTLNQLEVYAFSKVISEIKPNRCYVDSADVNAIRFGYNILKLLSYHPQIISKHRADSLYPIVSAASLIAKTQRDALIKDIEKELNTKLNLPLGSGYPADPITKRFLETWVQKFDSIPPYTRRSWKTIQRIMELHNTKNLNDFQ